MTATPAAGDFLGRWQLTRRIDHDDGSRADFEGEALVEAGAPAWTYVETGHLAIRSGPTLSATRRYFWQAEPNGIDVAFDDGRPFHRIDLAGGGDDHYCAPDLYRVRYDFGDWPVWRATWRVDGPRKSYTSLSIYRPLAPQGGIGH